MEEGMVAESIDVDSDFAYLLTLLPEGWQEKAKELGALMRRREIPDAETLLRLLLIHLAEGASLRQTAVLASQRNIAQLSDVAIMDRLNQAGEWFRWMNSALMESMNIRASEHVFGTSRRVRLVDATMISEPGSTGSSFRIDYAIELPSLHCDEFRATEPRGTNQDESFLRFAIEAGDLMIGDHSYGIDTGISHVLACGGDVLVPFAWNRLPMYQPSGVEFHLLKHLRRLHGTDVGDWCVVVGGDESTQVSGRICAIRKSRQAALAAQREVRTAGLAINQIVSSENLEAAEYVFVFTTVPSDEVSAADTLEMYRVCWQLEPTFKRLKTLLGVGHLRKSDPEATRAWMQGKLFVALVLELLRVHAERISRWGYRITQEGNA